MAKMIVVGCKLPHGITLEHPADPKKTVTLNGVNKAVIVGADYATTEVDEEFWAAWSEANKEFPAVKSGAIFAARSNSDVQAIGKENADRKTGMEPMRTDGKDPRASGVKVADKE